MSRRTQVRKLAQQVKRQMAQRFAGKKPSVAEVERVLREISPWLSFPPDIRMRYRVSENPNGPPIVAIQFYNPLTAVEDQ